MSAEQEMSGTEPSTPPQSEPQDSDPNALDTAPVSQPTEDATQHAPEYPAELSREAAVFEAEGDSLQRRSEEDSLQSEEAASPDPEDGDEAALDLAAEWGAALAADLTGDGAAVDGKPDAARVLSQAEIDSLLGFKGAEDHEARSGMERMVDAGLVSYERLPMLEIIFDRMVRIMSTSLRNFNSDNVDASIDGVSSQRFGEYLNSIPLPTMIAVFKIEEWDNYGILVVDSALIYSIVDVLLGGRRGTAAMRVEGRPYTTIERTLVERLVTVVLEDLTTAFAPLCPVRFRFERLEVNPRFAAISRHGNACVLARLRVDMEDRGGKIDLLIPYATLEPVRELLLQQFMGERFGRDNIWEAHLAEELRHTAVALQAVLDEQSMKLGQVLRLRVGDQIVLSVPPGAPVQLRCGETAMFQGELGRRENRMAVRIDQSFPTTPPPEPHHHGASA